MIARREFLSAAAAASFTPNLVFGSMAAPPNPVFVKVFMRGGADGLHLFPAVGDVDYYQSRPDLGIEPPSADINSAIDLGGLGGTNYRAMNPNLAPLMEIWDAGRMMIAPATAVSFNNLSHFDAQRWIEKGAQDNSIDGYLNRYLQIASRTDDHFRGLVAGKATLSTVFDGSVAVPVIPNAADYDIRQARDMCSGHGCAENQLLETVRSIASQVDGISDLERQIRQNQQVMAEAVDVVQSANSSHLADNGFHEYHDSDIGRGLKLIAEVLKANVQLEVATLDWNVGWDTHANQIPQSVDRFADQNFAFHRKIRDGAEDLATFFRDLGAHLDNVIVLVGSEFGRSVKQNGSLGTDHGHGGAFFAFGGDIKPGFGPDISSLAENELLDGQYVPGVVDTRDLIAEIMVKHMYLPESLVSTVLPGYAFTDHRIIDAR